MEPEINAPARPDLWEKSLACLFLGLAAYACARTEADPDLWGHLKFGQDLWETGRLPGFDVYSYLTAGQRWINHEWLSEAMFARVYSFGPAALVIFKSAVAFLTVSAAWRFLRGTGLNIARACLLTALPLLPFAAHLRVIRPTLFSWPLFLATLLIIRAAERGDGRKLWWLPPLFALWANLHGAFLAGLGLLLLWSLSRPKTLWLTALCFLATLLNPYGFGLWRFLLGTVFQPRPEIWEWQPLALMTFEGAGYLFLLALAGLGFAYSGLKKERRLLMLWLITAALPLAAVRHSLLFVIGLWAFAGEHIVDAWERRLPAAAAGPTAFRKALGGLHFAAAALLLFLAARNLRCIAVVPPPDYPSGAVALLREAGVQGNMLVHFDWGEYVIYQLGPGIRVSLDGRRETVYSGEVYREQLDFIAGRGRWDAALERGRPELALVSRAFPVFGLMSARDDWALVYEDAGSGLFVRRGSLWLNPLKAMARRSAPRPQPRCAEL